MRGKQAASKKNIQMIELDQSCIKLIGSDEGHDCGTFTEGPQLSQPYQMVSRPKDVA